MNSVNLLTNSSQSTLVHFNGPRNPTTTTISCSISCSIRRRNPNKHNTHPRPSSDPKLEMVIDIKHLSNRASLSLQRLLSSSELKLNQFVTSGKDAFNDLQTLITVDSNRRVVLSCRRSTLQFMCDLVLWSCIVAFAFRVLVKLGLGIRHRFGLGYGALVRRRDRSLAGKEVVVGKKEGFRVSTNALSPARGTAGRNAEVGPRNWVRREEKLPKWWPVSVRSPVAMVNKEEYQREANGLIRAIMDNRMSGKDIVEDDIIQLRRICRTSGARISIDTTNARDSFYRSSVDFVLNSCSCAASHSSYVQIDGEDARQFIAGFADNIGIENIRAARIVSAAVAARTRSHFLQAWALELQGKHSDAVAELSKICLIHRIFPPEESAPEMEMVARGLEKHLKVEHRKFLMNMLFEVCGEESRRSAAEALGLMLSPKGVRDQEENKYR